MVFCALVSGFYDFIFSMNGYSIASKYVGAYLVEAGSEQSEKST